MSPLPATCKISPVVNIQHQRGTFVPTDELHRNIILTQNPHLPQGALLVSDVLWVWTNVWKHVSLQGSLTALKLLCAPPIPPPQTLAATDLFTVSIVLPFPDSHILEPYTMEASWTGFFHLEVCIWVSFICFFMAADCVFGPGSISFVMGLRGSSQLLRLEHISPSLHVMFGRVFHLDRWICIVGLLCYHITTL